MVTRFHRQRAIPSQPITTLTNRPHHIARNRGHRGVGRDRHNAVISLIERRPREVVHGGVNDTEVFILAGLEVGETATTYGSGGGGGANRNASGTTGNGGGGGSGVIIIYEYI